VRAAAPALLLVLALAACGGPGAQVVPPGYARLAIACPDADAEVTVDGAPAGKAGDYRGGKGRLLLRPGRHRIELRSAGGQREVREAVLGPGDDVRLAVLLPRGEGKEEQR
jgi:hypothetical protein